MSLNTMYRTVTAAALLVALLAAVAQCRTLGSQPISVNTANQRLIDEFGREVLFHGVNVVVKGFPWVPDVDQWSPLTSFTDKDMAALQSLGLNCIRLGTMWPGAEPVRGQYNETYLQVLHDLVQKAAAYDIYSLLDMHQDVFSEKFCGEGVPLWAAIADPGSDFPVPLAAAYNTSGPDEIPSDADCFSHDWASYYYTKGTGSAFKNFYQNNYGLLDSWTAFWAKVASIMAPLGSAVLGYELMNEPWAGDAVADPLLMIPDVADKQNLQPAWAKAASAIRAVDTNHAIFFEGVTWDWFSVGFTEVPGGSQWGNKSVLSYHYYVPPDFSLDIQFNARLRDMSRLGCGGFLTETFLDTSVLAKAEELVQSWMIWEYKPFAHNKTGWATSIWNDNGTMNYDIASQLSRTYAQVVAGTTRTVNYNQDTKAFALTFAGNPQVTANVTKIYLNEALHYPNGYQVNVTTSVGNYCVTWSKVATNHIEVQHDLYAIAANDTVTVTITAK